MSIIELPEVQIYLPNFPYYASEHTVLVATYTTSKMLVKVSYSNHNDLTMDALIPSCIHHNTH